MKYLFRRSLTILALGALATLALSAQPRIFSKTGKARVSGRDVLVHVTVAVPPGQNADRVANGAIRAQGGIPITASEFSTTGLVWDQIANGSGGHVQQHYNPSRDATARQEGASILASTQSKWSNGANTNSAFAMEYDPSDPTDQTTRCPSLVRECPGRQVFDGNNDVAWVALKDPFTLAVTWSSSTIDEADVAMNTNQNWSYYDAESVLLHEQGHVAGLGHSEDPEAVMVAIYAGIRHQLQDDDKAGLATLYPLGITPPVNDCGNGAIDAGEQCDGLNLNGLTCTSLGFSGGDLSCSSCVIDESACTNNTPGCFLSGLGDSCTSDSECCSGKCRGRSGAKVCK